MTGHVMHRLPSLCWACAAGFHRHEGTSCDCKCHTGFSAYEADCPMCGGQGVVPIARDSFGNYDTDECSDCGGDGTVLIVAGVRNG